MTLGEVNDKLKKVNRRIKFLSSEDIVDAKRCGKLRNCYFFGKIKDEDKCDVHYMYLEHYDLSNYKLIVMDKHGKYVGSIRQYESSCGWNVTYDMYDLHKVMYRLKKRYLI